MKLKILIIAATPFFSDRGCHMRIYTETKYMQKLGARTRICTYHIGRDLAGFDIVRIGKVWWYKKLSPGFAWGKIWLDWKLAFLCAREIKKFQPDVIYGHLYEGLFIGKFARILAWSRAPLVADIQGDITEEFKSYNPKNRLAGKFFSWLAKKIIRWADWVTLSSENARKKIEKMYPQKSRISITKDGVDIDFFQNPPAIPREEQDKIEKLKNWKGGKKLLIYVGGLSDNKGVGDLLRPFIEYAEKNDDWRLALGGYGEDEEKYRMMAQDAGLGDKIVFLGKVAYFSLPHFLAVGDVTIDPKRGSAESSGKLVNSMAARLPVICYENEFTKSWLGDKGLFIQKPEDIKRVLIEQREPIERINYDLEDFSEEKEIKNLLEILKTVSAH